MNAGPRAPIAPRTADSGSARIDLWGTAALLFNVGIWSVTPVVLKMLTQRIDPFTANGLRYPMSAILFWPTIWLAWRRSTLPPGVLLRALVPAFFAGTGQIFWAMAPYYIPASDMGFFVKSSLASALIGSMVLFRRERLLLGSRHFWFGLVLCLVGFVALAAERGVSAAEVSAQGLAVILTCGVFFGLYGVAVRRFLSDTPPVLAFGLVSQYVSILTLSLLFIAGDPASIPGLAAATWWMLGITSILGIAISHVFFYISVVRIGPALTNSVHLLGPFLTCAAAYAVLGENLGLRGWLAGLVLITGAGLLLRAQEHLRSAAGKN